MVTICARLTIEKEKLYYWTAGLIYIHCKELYPTIGELMYI